MHKYLLTVLAIAGIALAGDLMINGNFEQELSNGWTQSSIGYYITIDRATTYEPDADYEVQVYKDVGSGSAVLYQAVDLQNMPLNQLEFSCKAKLYAYDNNADTLCYAATAVIVQYLNQTGTTLGETRICQFTAPCDWISTSTAHLLTVADSLWHNYSFNIATELANLPGVTPSNVKKLKIAMYDTTAHTC
ncbi:MAG TPA: hypothetical protein VF399_02130 [bacterium]|jgi:hypothetical protein